MTSLQDDIVARFIRYVKIDTESDEFSTAVPSTAKQYDLLNLLVEELTNMGAADIVLTDYAVVYATIPATIEAAAPTVAFFAHVDTSPAFSGANVKPIIHQNYDGSPIVLSGNTDLVINTENSPYLAQKIGEDIITTDGTTLLGADDKAGVAIVMSLAAHLLANPQIPHGPIRVAFTPDEEIGRGVSNVKLADVAADVAYTLDGGVRGEVIYETFSADKAIVKIAGVAAHPGYATGKLVNALYLAGKFLNKLPQRDQTPETTQGRQGFVHAYEVKGTATAVEIHLILRDFEREGLAAHGNLIKQIVAELQAEEPRATMSCEIIEQYRNMRYWLENDMRPVEIARTAVESLGIKVVSSPIRGGTDGSRLTEMGLPTPNLFTGMQNFHSPTEWVSVQDMVLATEICLEIAKLWAEEK